MPWPSLRIALLLAGSATGAALFAALASEWWGGLVPCALCLLARWPYRVALAAALAGVILPARWRAAAAAAAALAMLGGVAIGVVHVGVEAGLWPSPLPGCAARLSAGGTLAEQLARLPARPAKPCDEPTYLLPGLPLSMAALSLAFCAAVAAGLFAVLLRRPREA